MGKECARRGKTSNSHWRADLCVEACVITIWLRKLYVYSCHAMMMDAFTTCVCVCAITQLSVEYRGACMCLLFIYLFILYATLANKDSGHLTEREFNVFTVCMNYIMYLL